MQKIKIAFIPVFLLILSSCGMAQILGLPKQEAKRRLQNGDAGFIMEAKLPEKVRGALSLLRPVGSVHPQAAFFAGLLAESAERAAPMEIPGRLQKSSLLFALALESNSPAVRREACRKLMLPVLEGSREFAEEVLNFLAAGQSAASSGGANAYADALRNICFYRINPLGPDSAGIYPSQNREIPADNENPSDMVQWNTAIHILSMVKGSGTMEEIKPALRNEAVSFFLTTPVSAPWIWALKELNNCADDFFNPAETAAIAARTAASESRFVQCLAYFSLFAEETGFILQYPELVRDLGRAFQFTPAAANEGIEIFTAWENQQTENPRTASQELVYLLNYFLGRIYRQQGQFGESCEAFEKALKSAPDGAQADACIWYILMNTVRENPESSANVFRKYIPLMQSMAYFDDVLDRFCQQLAARKNWKTMEEIFIFLDEKNAGGNAISQFAWILGRAAEEKYFTPGVQRDFYRIIYENRDSSIYYSVLAAGKLGLDPVSQPAPEPKPEVKITLSPGSEFLLYFLNFNMADYILPFIREYENEIPIPELRVLADNLAKAGCTDMSLNLVSRYMDRQDFELSRDDLKVYFPRPFQELTEEYAEMTGVPPHLLFALIRTESYFRPDAVSRSGAVGLCQLMPDTAMDMAGRIARRTWPDGIVRDYRTPDGIDLKNPEISIHIGSFYLNYLIETAGSPMAALIAYNGGLGRLRRWRAAEPRLPDDLFLETVEFQETRDFGKRVLAAAAIYGNLNYGLNMDEVIADIY